MHEVGQVSSRALFPMEDEHHPRGPAWTPDDKPLRFIHNDAPCAVPVD